MILKIAQHQQAQTLPFVAAVIFLIFVVLLVSLAMSSVSLERTNQQAAADAASLAGANVLAKGVQLIKLVDFIVWMRNAVLETLYIAATIATIATLGSASALFEVPISFDKATQGAVIALERTKEVIKEITPIYAVGNSVAYLQANNANNYYGLAVPFPLDFSVSKPSAAEEVLKKKIEAKNRELIEARQAMADAWVDYYNRKNELDKEEIATDVLLKRLKKEAEQASGRVGGLTAWRNRYVAELRRLETARGRFFKAGQDGMVAIVFHESSPVPFGSFFSGSETGFNIAVSAAKVEEGEKNFVIGEEAINNLFSKVPVLGRVGEALPWLLDALNIWGGNLRNLGNKYGIVGQFIGQALNRLNLVPPDITEVRPVLAGTQAVAKDTIDSQLGDFIGKVRDLIVKVREIEERFGKKVLPDDFEI